MHANPTKLAISATLHCLMGCGAGEVLGMIISTAANFGTTASVLLSVVLAFLFGYLFSLTPLVKNGMTLKQALKLALAADTVSIASMEITDNIVILLIPSAISAGLNTALFWLSLLASLVVAFIVTVPVNRRLILRGKGHALVHHHMH